MKYHLIFVNDDNEPEIKSFFERPQMLAFVHANNLQDRALMMYGNILHA